MKDETRSFYELAVERAALHVMSGLDGALDLRELARGAALSPFHFHRIFRGMLGETDQQGEETMKTEIKDVKEMRVAMVPHVGPYNRISEAFARLGQLAGGADLIREGAIMLALYSDDPETTPPSDLRSDAALSVPPDAVLPPGLLEGRLPGGRYACAVRVGPYEHLGDAWARLMGEWLPRSGHRVKDGPSFERYLNTPGNAPREKLETELYVPLG